MNKTLIIHPSDKTTDFLKPIYEDIRYRTIITGGLYQSEVHSEIEKHDRILMMGHGSENGLYNFSDFLNCVYIIDHKSVPFLKGKECIFIWCNADGFVNKYELNGFYTGMFISEVKEAEDCGLGRVEQKVVTESNNRFARLMRDTIEKPLNKIYLDVSKRYGKLGSKNPVASYNTKRIYVLHGDADVIYG